MKSFLITAAIFFGICFIYILIMLSTTEHYFTYLLDDAYIHMAIAKNFAVHGIWGMTRYAFSSSSSSPVFTLILSALIFLFGDHALIPLIFNLVSVGLLIVILNKYYSLFFNQNRSIVWACLFSLFFAVLHVQIVTGMEHILQTLMIAINMYCFKKWSDSEGKDRISQYGFYFTLLSLGLIRFESMFYFVSLAFVFMLIRKWKDSALVLVCGFVPIFLFGYINYPKSGYFFPNSVIAKGSLIDFSGSIPMQIIDLVLKKVILNTSFYKIGLFPLMISMVLLYKDYQKKLSFQKIIANNFLIVAWNSTFILHSLFGEIKGQFRYEAYLLVAFAMVLIPKLTSFFAQPLQFFRKERIIGISILANVLLLVYKSGHAHMLIANGSANIYEQQIQSARFLKKYYNSSKVVANDIGAICYFTDIHLLDFMGLGSKEMLPFRTKDKRPDDQFENFLTRSAVENQYQLAIAYEEWLDGHTPKNWKKVAYLEVGGKNVVLGEKHLFIYSINPEIHNSLQQNIRNFNWNKNVKVTIIE
ncbi:hypothetical protein J2810_004744 [Chryseobacterium rhizosphaerae]|uniref:hypothetical protein n=1 Tax=Chryseobacterium rhizosphaerae TaxID=395937 RepID=UPI0028647E87|nr:hypothetical protein [Chryseobacterium rhizosphaerae]MDR6548654.1 hypothetical protein [Chryseobacterium rhizosphaerae]